MLYKCLQTKQLALHVLTFDPRSLQLTRGLQAHRFDHVARAGAAQPYNSAANAHGQALDGIGSGGTAQSDIVRCSSGARAAENAAWAAANAAKHATPTPQPSAAIRSSKDTHVGVAEQDALATASTDVGAPAANTTEGISSSSPNTVPRPDSADPPAAAAQLGTTDAAASATVEQPAAVAAHRVDTAAQPLLDASVPSSPAAKHAGATALQSQRSRSRHTTAREGRLPAPAAQSTTLPPASHATAPAESGSPCANITQRNPQAASKPQPASPRLTGTFVAHRGWGGKPRVLSARDMEASVERLHKGPLADFVFDPCALRYRALLSQRSSTGFAAQPA